MAALSESGSASSSVDLPHHFSFPSRVFGKSKAVRRSFQSKWFDKYTWLHYEESQDAAYCHTCRSADRQGKLRTKYKDSAFISRGFTNWKDGTVSFTKHESSVCHKEAVEVMDALPRTTRNIGDQLSQIHAPNKLLNRKMLLKIIQNIIFLARQSIALRGDGDESDGNFI